MGRTMTAHAAIAPGTLPAVGGSGTAHSMSLTGADANPEFASPEPADGTFRPGPRPVR